MLRPYKALAFTNGRMGPVLTGAARRAFGRIVNGLRADRPLAPSEPARPRCFRTRLLGDDGAPTLDFSQKLAANAAT